jgi:hypothetical protein
MQLTLMAMLTHLCNNGVELDNNAVADRVSMLYEPWDLSENPTMKFMRDDKMKKQLTKKQVTLHPAIPLALVKVTFQATGKCKLLSTLSNAKLMLTRPLLIL